MNETEKKKGWSLGEKASTPRGIGTIVYLGFKPENGPVELAFELELESGEIINMTNEEFCSYNVPDSC